MSRIGVFGGTFDPPHVGHLITAINVRYALRLDTVLLVVANVPWQKLGTRAITDARLRLELVAAAVADVDGLEASGIEIERGGPSYTADTLAELALTEPDAELFVIVGADAAAALDTWERVEEVRSITTVVVVDRPGVAPVTLGDQWRWTSIEVPHVEVSSTDLRARVGDGRPLDFLVTDRVLDQIHRLGLYRTEP